MKDLKSSVAFAGGESVLPESPKSLLVVMIMDSDCDIIAPFWSSPVVIVLGSSLKIKYAAIEGFIGITRGGSTKDGDYLRGPPHREKKRDLSRLLMNGRQPSNTSK